MGRSIWAKYIERDLKSLYDSDSIERADNLNVNTTEDVFCSNMEPMYFTGKLDAKTVMIMLNPGAEDKEYRFSEKGSGKARNNDKYRYREDYEDFSSYLDSYVCRHEKYGEADYERLDNFDLKQAAFLHDFENAEIDIPDRFWESGIEARKEAKKNVLMQKLQLELVPYCSRTFQGLFSSKKKALENFTLIEDDIERLLEIITLYERKYVLFCSRQFQNIFNAAKEIGGSEICIDIGDERKVESIVMKSALRMCTVRIHYKQKVINAAIIHSFALQSLPNAYAKMRKYGKFCFDRISDS